MPNDLDRRAAELLGWRYDPTISGEPRWLTMGERAEHVYDWHPTESLDQAALLEAEIVRRGFRFQMAYGDAVLKSCPGNVFPMTWLITAPASARVEAAVKVLENHVTT